MGIGEVNGKILRGGWSAATKPCDACKSAAALVFRRADSAFLCAACDEGGAHRGGGEHERVWMCEVCEQAPAAVTCKADAAALCATCDRDIHSANPLARRHDRLPVVPFFEPAASLLKPSSAADADAAVASFLVPDGADEEAPNHNKALDEAEAASWILPNPGGNPNHKLADAAPDHGLKSGEFLFHDTDPFLDFDYAPPVDARFSDSLVPVRNRPLAPQILGHRSSENCFDLDFARSKLSPYTYPAQSLSQSVSSEVCVVPGGNSMSDVSYPLGKQLGGGELNSSAASHATQLSGSEREARVLRYREKRKNRKFEKTIRYASRKAYAETRPRIKGRFAKRAEIDADVVDACFYGGTANAAATAFEFSDSGYGVVPSY